MSFAAKATFTVVTVLSVGAIYFAHYDQKRQQEVRPAELCPEPAMTSAAFG